MAAEAAVSFAVEMLGSLLIEKAVFLQGVEGQVKWLQNDKDVVGLEREVELVLEKVILDEGMGGIGKSTLARMVYNHIAVADAFECRAWVVVSSEFTPEDVINQMMMQLHVSTEGGLDAVEAMTDKLTRQEILKEKLHQNLRGKRYFIVLDDVWEQTHWEALASAFPDQGQGSSSRRSSLKESNTCLENLDPCLKESDTCLENLDPCLGSIEDRRPSHLF